MAVKLLAGAELKLGNSSAAIDAVRRGLALSPADRGLHAALDQIRGSQHVRAVAMACALNNARFRGIMIMKS